MQRQISARWLLLNTMNAFVVIGGTMNGVVPCGTDVLCEGKNPQNNPGYFKPTFDNLQRCYCDKECVEYGDCCVDWAPFPYNRTENITWSCLAKSYNETIYAVSNCIIKEGWSKLCEKEVYVPKMEYLSDLPVYSNYTGLYYANVFCAYCDPRLWLKYGYQLTDYISKPKLINLCSPKINLDMLNAEGQYVYGRLMWKVRNGYCMIYQQDEIQSGRPCLPSVSTCPAGADMSLSARCEAYSQLLSKNDTVYRNPHCAMCNGVNKSESFCKYKKHTFKYPGLIDIFSLNWYLDKCEDNMNIRDNMNHECKAVNCELESGKCYINKCNDTCYLKGEDMATREYVIYVCLSASIICLLIHVYRSIFISPPKNLPSKILSSLAWSMLIAQTLFLTSMYSSAKLPHHSTLCYITAVTIQYFFLASFFWMSVISFDIWFTFSNTFKLFSTSYTKYAIYAWGVTAIIMVISIFIDRTDYFPNYLRPKFGPTNNVCWLGSYIGLALYLAAPIGILLFLNTVFFIMTICLFFKQQTCVLAISGRKEYSLLLFYVKISTVIGMTWIFTLIIMSFSLGPEVHCVLSILNGLQGVFIFITFDMKAESVFAYVKLMLLRIFGNR